MGESGAPEEVNIFVSWTPCWKVCVAYSLDSEDKVSTEKLLINKKCVIFVICALTEKKLQMSFTMFMCREGKKPKTTQNICYSDIP